MSSRRKRPAKAEDTPEARAERARLIHEQIDSITSGEPEADPEDADNPRDFIERQTRSDDN